MAGPLTLSANGEIVDHTGTPVTSAGTLAAHDADAAAHSAAITAALAGVLTQSPDFLDTYAHAYDEFFGSGSTDGQIAGLGWRTSLDGVSGTVAPFSATQANHPGVYALATGTDAAGRGGIYFSNFQLEDTPEFIMEWIARIPVLSTLTTNEAIARLGVIDSASTTDPTDGIYFEYDISESANWMACTAVGGVRTKTDTGVAVETASYHKFKAVSDGAGTVTFYIDGVLVATTTTNLPAASNAFGPVASIAKVSGTTTLTMRVDTFWLLWAVTR